MAGFYHELNCAGVGLLAPDEKQTPSCCKDGASHLYAFGGTVEALSLSKRGKGLLQFWDTGGGCAQRRG
jgi:hypothetical protein